MTQIVSIPLPDEVFAALERKAESQGQSVVEVAAAAIASKVEDAVIVGPLDARKPDGLCSLFGSIAGSGEVDNDSIDRDLKREYRGE